MQRIETARLLQGLTGSQPIILLAFLMIGQAMTIQDLCDVTGKDDDALRRGLKKLKAKGYLELQRGEHGRQVWLPAGDLLPGIQDDQLPHFTESGATTTTIKLREGKSQGKTAAAADLNRRQLPYFKQADLDQDEKAIWRALRKIGVGEPMRTRLARETRYTVAHVWAHGLYGAREGLDIGLIIHRIRNEDWISGHLVEDARAEIQQFYKSDEESEEA